ncbi:hypothetical protein GQ457_16G012480 [Hibiscus cannabinus]
MANGVIMQNQKFQSQQDMTKLQSNFKELEKKLEDKIEKSFTEKFQGIRSEVSGIRQEVREMKALLEAVLGQSITSNEIFGMSPTDGVICELAKRVEEESTTTTMTAAATPKINLQKEALSAEMVFDEILMRDEEVKVDKHMCGSLTEDYKPMEATHGLNGIDDSIEELLMPYVVETSVANGSDNSLPKDIASSPLIGTSNPNLNIVPTVIRKPNSNLDDIIDPVTGIWIGKLNLNFACNVKPNLNRELDKSIKGTSNFGDNLFRECKGSVTGLMIRNALIVDLEVAWMDTNEHFRRSIILAYVIATRKHKKHIVPSYNDLKLKLIGNVDLFCTVEVKGIESNTSYGFIDPNLNVIVNVNSHYVIELFREILVGEIFDPGGKSFANVAREALLSVLEPHLNRPKRVMQNIWSNHLKEFPDEIERVKGFDCSALAYVFGICVNNALIDMYAQGDPSDDVCGVFKVIYDVWVKTLQFLYAIEPEFVRMLSVAYSSHVRAIFKVPLESYMTDLVLFEKEDGGTFDNKDGVYYFIPILGGFVKEPPTHIVHIAVEMAPIAKVGCISDVASPFHVVQDINHNVNIILSKHDCLILSHVKELHYQRSSFWGAIETKNWFGKVESNSVCCQQLPNGIKLKRAMTDIWSNHLKDSTDST